MLIEPRLTRSPRFACEWTATVVLVQSVAEIPKADRVEVEEGDTGPWARSVSGLSRRSCARMRAVGMAHDEIAVEFARRYPAATSCRENDQEVDVWQGEFQPAPQTSSPRDLKA